MRSGLVGLAVLLAACSSSGAGLTPTTRDPTTTTATTTTTTTSSTTTTTASSTTTTTAPTKTIPETTLALVTPTGVVVSVIEETPGGYRVTTPCGNEAVVGEGRAAAVQAGMGQTMSQKKVVRLAGTALSRSRHVCAFFNTKDEEYRVLLPFIKEGFEQGDKAFHIVKEGHRPEHRRRLQQAGIAVDEAERKGLDLRAGHARTPTPIGQVTPVPPTPQ